LARLAARAKATRVAVDFRLAWRERQADKLISNLCNACNCPLGAIASHNFGFIATVRANL
jgi:hypothetical protein